MSFGGIARLIPGGVQSLDRNPAAFLSFRGRPKKKKPLTLPAAGRTFEKVLFLFETVPVLSSAEETSCILESLQQSFEEFCCQNNLCKGSVQTLTASFQFFFFF